MANYYATTRTNYFHLKEGKEQEFKDLVSKIISFDDDVHLFEREENGDKTYGFGANGCLTGIKGENDGEIQDFTAVIEKLQEYVADNDAIIILEAGHEKLRYVVGSATIITSSQVNYYDMQNAALQMAKDMLNNQNWETRIDY